MLTITKLKSAEYVLRSVADGMEDYFMGAGEAPGVWHGRWAPELGLEGVVAADDLRALIEGVRPGTGEELLAGLREREVTAIDVTLSVPKSVSMLWAFGSPETSSIVALAVVEATDRALDFLEQRAAVTRRQEGGVRRRVGTEGFAIATFAHRTSRDGDPQLHTHCLIPNVVRRDDDRHVAFDAAPLHTWAKASGTVFLNELELAHPQRIGPRDTVGDVAVMEPLADRLDPEAELVRDPLHRTVLATLVAGLAHQPDRLGLLVVAVPTCRRLPW